MQGRVLTGRCANGNERDRGAIIHAVEGWKALCGREPGRRSAGWSEWERHELSAVNCPRCRKKLDKEGSK